ncbi:hypothetical protein E2C01_043539 [Portunus trituberculatus]|uniref:Uncharacterized protein n=1 Tax=Portunus trituberculatus TaxID=210409 RepID=A0A5B7FWD9_PORTR|nr:hypothetical protein [Portunus trituberculatus]
MRVKGYGVRRGIRLMERRAARWRHKSGALKRRATGDPGAHGLFRRSGGPYRLPPATHTHTNTDARASMPPLTFTSPETL